MGSSRNRGTSAVRTRSSTCSSRTLPRPSRSTSATSSTTRRTCAGLLQPLADSAARSCGRDALADDPLLQEVLADELLAGRGRARPCASGSARCAGSGMPSGCLNSAVTANQSAIAPTMDASAPALTKPSQPVLAQGEQVDDGGEDAGARPPPSASGAAPRRRASSAAGSAIDHRSDGRSGWCSSRSSRPIVPHGCLRVVRRRRRGRRRGRRRAAWGDARDDADRHRACPPGAARRAAARSARCGPTASRTVCSTNAPWYSTAVTTPSPGPSRGAVGERHLVRTQDHLDVDVDAAPPGHGRDDADLAGQQRVVDVGGQEVGVAHERRHEARRRPLEDAPAACRPARCAPRASRPPGRRPTAPRSGRG